MQALATVLMGVTIRAVISRALYEILRSDRERDERDRYGDGL